MSSHRRIIRILLTLPSTSLPEATFPYTFFTPTRVQKQTHSRSNCWHVRKLSLSLKLKFLQSPSISQTITQHPASSRREFLPCLGTLRCLRSRMRYWSKEEYPQLPLRQCKPSGCYAKTGTRGVTAVSRICRLRNVRNMGTEVVRPSKQPRCKFIWWRSGLQRRGLCSGPLPCPKLLECTSPCTPSRTTSGSITKAEITSLQRSWAARMTLGSATTAILSPERRLWSGIRMPLVPNL
mmetsp:Transcript_34251/g.47483  ORF Transcript_34251/g.47483 Transcript_34251/m.47483 type:complete len:237 (+) Transcript_34251:173-883(+)